MDNFADTDWQTEELLDELNSEISQLKKQNAELLEALINLESEFRKTFPVYYYAEPWAHDKNIVLKEAQVTINKAGESK